MTPERWRRVDELFRTIADRPLAEREALLTRVCGGDDELRREVLELLAHDPPDSFLHDPIKHATVAVTHEPKDDLLNTRIGPYRLTRLIGHGGMGAVYEAVRDDDQFQHQVALKLIKRGMDSDFVRDRFLRERQILASLDHPHIARLFDGGTTRMGCRISSWNSSMESPLPIIAASRNCRSMTSSNSFAKFVPPCSTRIKNWSFIGI